MTEETLIAELDRALAAERPAVYATLQPGASAPALDELQATLSAPLPALFRALYLWRDGQPEECRERFWDVWYFLPLEEVRRCKDMLDGMIGYDFEDPNWWSRGWVPFLGNRNGDHVCLDLTAETKRQPGQLIKFWHDWEDRSVVAPDLASWMDDLVRPPTIEALLARLLGKPG